MPDLVWVLIYTVNGLTQQMAPDISEACLMHLMVRPASQQAYCVNTRTGERLYPPPPPVQQKRK
jgi:hypothetical protein